MRTRQEIEDRQRRLRQERSQIPTKERTLQDVVTSAYLAGALHSIRWMMQPPGTADNSLPPEISNDEAEKVLERPNKRNVVSIKNHLTEQGKVGIGTVPPPHGDVGAPAKVVGHFGDRPVVDGYKDLPHGPEEGYDA
jgi:hypothetical protein